MVLCNTQYIDNVKLLHYENLSACNYPHIKTYSMKLKPKTYMKSGPNIDSSVEYVAVQGNALGGLLVLVI